MSVQEFRRWASTRWDKLTLSIALAALTALLLAACTPTPTPEPPPLTNRISYIGENGNLWIINPDGSHPKRLTGNTLVGASGVIAAQGIQSRDLYAWPTWAPDGTKVAASRVTSDDVSISEVALVTIDVGTGMATTVYVNKGEGTLFVADNTPHYIYWSPDSQRLAYLAGDSRGLAMYITDPSEPDNPNQILFGAPLYLHWAPDSRFLLVHQGQTLYLADSHRRGPPTVLFSATGFRAPAWNPDGASFLFSGSEGSQGNSLMRADETGKNLLIMTPVDTGVAFLWSPDGEKLAFADTFDPTIPFYQRLMVLDKDDGEPRALVQEELLAFFWSPDSEKISYVVFDSSKTVFLLKVINLEDESTRTVAKFLPSREMVTWLLFFDQFVYSNSLWSSDSSSLVFTGTLMRDTEPQDEGSQVFVVSVDKESPPRAIASGSLAFWSWN